MAHIAVSIMTNCAAIRHISGSHVAYSGTHCAAIRHMFRQLMCVPTMIHNDSLWVSGPGRGGVLAILWKFDGISRQSRRHFLVRGDDFSRPRSIGGKMRRITGSFVRPRCSLGPIADFGYMRRVLTLGALGAYR
jgi:hypothetical protein